LNGAIFATLVGLVAGFWFDNPQLGGIIATAMVVNMLVAALAGILIPLLLDRFGADPAVASAVFVTTITDVVGFFAFLGLATWWFGRMWRAPAGRASACGNQNLSRSWCRALISRTVPEDERMTMVWVWITSRPNLTPDSMLPSVTPVAANSTSPRA